MTKSKLLELYEKFRLERLNTSFINNLKDFSDHEVYLILNSVYTDITIRLMINKDFKVLHQGLKDKLINIVNNAKNRTIAEYTALLIENEDVLASGLVLELSKIISRTQETYQALNTLSVATNKMVLSSDILAIHLSQIVSKTIGEQKSFNVTQVATSKDVLTMGPAITLTQIVYETSSNCKSDLAASVAKNKTLLEAETPVVITYTQQIKNAKTDEEAKLIYSQIRKEINKLKKEKEELVKKQKEEYNNEFTFWQIYEQNPEKAISLLKENIKDNEEITIHTRVRRK